MRAEYTTGSAANCNHSPFDQCDYVIWRVLTLIYLGKGMLKNMDSVDQRVLVELQGSQSSAAATRQPPHRYQD